MAKLGQDMPNDDFVAKVKDRLARLKSAGKNISLRTLKSSLLQEENIICNDEELLEVLKGILIHPNFIDKVEIKLAQGDKNNGENFTLMWKI